MNPPPVPTDDRLANVFPSGPRIFTALAAIVSPLIRRLMRWPAMPVKPSRAFCPGTPSATVPGAPPATIDPPTSCGTSYSEIGTLPVVATTGCRRIEYTPPIASDSGSMKPPPAGIA
jgi:hypothetical protein